MLNVSRKFINKYQVNNEAILSDTETGTVFNFVVSFNQKNQSNKMRNVMSFYNFLKSNYGNKYCVVLWTNAIFNVPAHKVNDVKRIIAGISSKYNLIDDIIYIDEDNDLRIKLTSNLLEEYQVIETAESFLLIMSVMLSELYPELKAVYGLNDMTFEV